MLLCSIGSMLILGQNILSPHTSVWNQYLSPYHLGHILFLWSRVPNRLSLHEKWSYFLEENKRVWAEKYSIMKTSDFSLSALLSCCNFQQPYSVLDIRWVNYTLTGFCSFNLQWSNLPSWCVSCLSCRLRWMCVSQIEGNTAWGPVVHLEVSELMWL